MDGWIFLFLAPLALIGGPLITWLLRRAGVWPSAEQEKAIDDLNYERGKLYERFETLKSPTKQREHERLFVASGGRWHGGFDDPVSLIYAAVEFIVKAEHNGSRVALRFAKEVRKTLTSEMGLTEKDIQLHTGTVSGRNASVVAATRTRLEFGSNKKDEPVGTPQDIPR